MPTDYGNFHDFCRDSTLPVCNLYTESPVRGGPGYGGCQLVGIPLSGNRHLRNLGSIILCGIAILVTLGLLWKTQRKRAAVGRREMQFFFLGYILIEICEIFTVGGFPLDSTVRIAFTGIHLGAIVATTWILMLNGAIGYQLIDDGTAISVILMVVSAAALFIGTGYIALDTGYGWTDYWQTNLIQMAPNREYSLYTLYLLVPMVFLFIYFVLETVLVLTVLGETKPLREQPSRANVCRDTANTALVWLVLAVLSFAVGQIFDFLVSPHICTGTSGKIDGALFETLFTLIAVVLIWVFWSSITEDDWPQEQDATSEVWTPDPGISTALPYILHLLPPSRDWAALRQPYQSPTIASRRPANIPLHTLSNSSRPLTRRFSSSQSDSQDEKARDRRSSESAGSEFSLWSDTGHSDTGDLVDQLADEDDPLQFRPNGSVDEEEVGLASRRRGRRTKRVRYHEDTDFSSKEAYSGVPKKKEDITVPDPQRKPISGGEKLLAIIMAPRDGPSRIHGLHGKKLIYFTSVFVSLGVFLFGYDQGVMSGIITGPYFKDYFNQPSRAEIGTMVAILEIGALIASLSIGTIGDIIGRRRTIFWGSMVFLVGGAFQTFSNGMPMMMIGRIIAGLGVGALSTIVPVYQSEISPPHNRGKLACIEFTGNISGYATSVWVDYVCTYIKSDWAWRIPLLMQCVMGALLGVGSLVICESPRWLLDNDHDEEGIVVIANLYGKGDIHNPKARDEFREIKMNVLLQRQEGERSYMDMFKRYYKRVFIAMSAQALAQLNGINVISYYAPLVFEQANWVGRQAILMTGINALTYLASTIPPWYLVDRWGRRFILLSGAVAMIISLSAMSYFIYLDVKATPTLVVIFVMLYNASFGASWGPIPWLYPPEILPLSIRAKGASLSTAANWAFNWLVGEMTPILQELIQWRLYLVHAFFCALSFVVVYFIYPETANVRLEDMNVLFGDATSQMPTPASSAEESSLVGQDSPVPSLNLGPQGADSAIPGLDIDPPNVDVENGKPMLSRGHSEQKEGLGGWISNLVRRSKPKDGDGHRRRSSYAALGQDDD
ncbi:MAG: hypothetical protein M1828_005935 [Chrysothrix sp. TS-e1954]|nr:MAG: hypothetical protein M1828_005935 [Chrysothrix sp. TS-e1954]